MTCTLLAVGVASVTDSARAGKRAGVLFVSTQRARVNRWTNRVCELDAYVPFSHYLPQPFTVLLKNLAHLALVADNIYCYYVHDSVKIQRVVI